MPPPQTMTLDFKPGDEHFTQADFTYSITPDAISITDTGRYGLGSQVDFGKKASEGSKGFWFLRTPKAM
jgi:hypothetical protein